MKIQANELLPVKELSNYSFKHTSNFNHCEALLTARTIVGLSTNWLRKRVYADRDRSSYYVKVSTYESDFGERLRGKGIVVSAGLMYSINTNIFGTTFEVFVMTIREIVVDENGNQTFKPTLRVSEGLFGTEFLKKLQYQARKEQLPIEMIDHHLMFPDL